MREMRFGARSSDPLAASVAPDPRVLQEALVRVTQLTGVPDGSLRWIVGRSRRRPRSIIFPLRAVSRTGPVAAAFYKQLWVRPGDSNAQAVRSEFVRAVTARSVALTNKVAAVAVRENIWLAPILAADLDRPAMITMKVPGRPLGKTVWSALAPGRRRALTAFLRLGRAIRLIEAATAGDVTPHRAVSGAGLPEARPAGNGIPFGAATRGAGETIPGVVRAGRRGRRRHRPCARGSRPRKHPGQPGRHRARGF